MQGGRDHEAERDALDFFAHDALRLDGVGDDIGERAVVADAAAEDVVDVVLHAVVHDARIEDAFFDGGADAAGAADAVDRAEVVLVARFDDVAAFELHAEAGGEERLFDVVRGEGVAREQDFEIAFADQFAEVFAAAAVNDGGATDEQGFAFAFGAEELLGDLADRDVLGLFRRNRAIHELEAVRLALALGWEDADAGVADDDFVAEFGVEHRDAAGGAGCFVDHDAAVHFLRVDGNPLALQADFRSLVRGAVEVFGERAADVDGFDRAVVFVDADGAVVGDLGEDFVELLASGGGDFDEGAAGVGAGLADEDVFEFKRAALGHDLVEDFGQEQAIDDVPAEFDFLDEFGGLVGCGHRVGSGVRPLIVAGCKNGSWRREQC